MLQTQCNMEDHSIKNNSLETPSQTITKSATITLNADIKTVFPLFGPIEEKKWAEGWNPKVLHPENTLVEEGMVFVTKSHAEKEAESLWAVTKYNPEKHLISYTVSTQNRIWFISIYCEQTGSNQTKTIITYTFTSRNQHGIKLNQQSLEKMYKYNLEDWEEAINQYLATGKMLVH